MKGPWLCGFNVDVGRIEGLTALTVMDLIADIVDVVAGGEAKKTLTSDVFQEGVGLLVWVDVTPKQFQGILRFIKRDVAPVTWAGIAGPSNAYERKGGETP